MKACVLRRQAPIESLPLTLEDVPTPQPSSNQVLVRVNACGICRTDLHLVEGELPQRKLPVIPGHQGIHMSPIPPIDYQLLYHERVIRTVANNTRQDGEDF